MIEKRPIKKIIFFVIFSIVVLTLLLAFVSIAIDIRGNRFAEFDEKCLNFALSIRSGWLTVAFRIITNLVNPIVIGIVGFCILVFAKNRRIFSFQLFLNMGIVAILNLVFKYFFVRNRPDEIFHLVSETGYSFPSGHAMFAVAFYGFLIYMLWNTQRKKSTKIVVTIIGVILVALISFSRIYLLLLELIQFQKIWVLTTKDIHFGADSSMRAKALLLLFKKKITCLFNSQQVCLLLYLA